MDLAEDMLRFIVKTILDNYASELHILERDTTSLEKLVNKAFVRITYDRAVEILRSEDTASLLDQMLEDRKNRKRHDFTRAKRTP